MNRKIKILSSSMLAMGAIASPIATLVSCGGSSTDYSNIVAIKTTWSANGPQFKAMEKIVKEYNKVKKSGDMEAKLIHIEGGYGTIGAAEARDIQNKHMKSVSNLFIDYPDAIGGLARLDAQLDLSSLKSNSLDRAKFDSRFTKVYDNIENTDRTTKSQLFGAPLAVSGEMLTANLPLMKRFLIDVASNGGTVKGMTNAGVKDANTYSNLIYGSLLKKAVDYAIDKSNNSDDAAVNKLWKLASTDASQFNGFSIDENTFQEYEAINEFANKIQKAYGKKGSSSEYVLGIDAPTNALYQSIFAKGGFKFDKKSFPYSIDSKGTGDYEGFKNSSSDAAKVVKQALGIFNNSVNSGSTRFNGGGAFTSADLVEHRAALSWGSTAGYTHNYKSGNSYEFKGKKLEHLKVIKQKPATNTDPKVLGVTDDKYGNVVYKDSDPIAKVGSHDVRISDAAATILVAQLKSGSDRAFMSSDKIFSDNKGTKTTEAIKGKHTYYIADDNKDVTTKGDSGSTLQKNEAAFVAAPNKFFGITNDTTSMVQGPSFIAIKHSNDNDVETGKFLNWFFDAKSKIEGDQGEVSIVKFFDTEAKYITPLKDAFKATATNYKEGNSIVFETFKETTGSNVISHAFQAPVTQYSSPLRKTVVDTALKDVWTNSAKKDETKTPDDIYDQIKTLANSIIG